MKRIILLLAAVLTATVAGYGQTGGGHDVRSASLMTTSTTVSDSDPEASRHPGEPEMVFVEGGTFEMGSTGEGAENDEKPVHQVTLSNFHISKYEITQAQWLAIMGTTVAQQRDKADKSLPLYGEGNNYPMYYVSWDEVQEFIAILNYKTGKNYDLPTEAQWEYAARGGNKSKNFTYSGHNIINVVGWYDGNSGSQTHQIPPLDIQTASRYDSNTYSQTHPVGTKLPNELGIFDMSGNVWEWCGDWKGSYSASAHTDPTGPSSGSYRVCRGGSWGGDTQYCRSANRDGISPGSRNGGVGFRLVLLP